MNLWVGVVECRWNSKHPLVFQACALWRVNGISLFHNVKTCGTWNAMWPS